MLTIKTRRDPAGAPRAPKRELCTVLGLDAQFLAHEVIEQRGRRVVASDRLLRRDVEDRRGVMEVKGAERLGERQRGGEVTARRRHLTRDYFPMSAPAGPRNRAT